MLVRDYFARTLPVWDDLYRSDTLYAALYRERLARALALAERLNPKGLALDVGCGPGRGSIGLARLGFRVQAVDALLPMVTRTVERARAEGVEPKVAGAVAELGALPFSDQTFDLLLVIGVSEWLAQLPPALGELARVLKPGGHLIFSADNSWALSCLLDPLDHPLVVPLKRAFGVTLRRIWPRQHTPRTRGYSRRAIDSALSRAGLVPLSGETLGFGPFTWLHRPLLSERAGGLLDRRLRGVPALRSSGLVHLVVARKGGFRANTA